MIWNGMTVYGETFSPEEQLRAWDAWTPATGWQRLGDRLRDARGLELPNDVAARGADRMLQRARKAGLALYQDGRWSKHTPDKEG